MAQPEAPAQMYTIVLSSNGCGLQSREALLLHELIEIFVSLDGQKLVVCWAGRV